MMGRSTFGSATLKVLNGPEDGSGDTSMWDLCSVVMGADMTCLNTSSGVVVFCSLHTLMAT